MASGGAGAGPIGVYGDRLSRVTKSNVDAGLAPRSAAAALKARVARNERYERLRSDVRNYGIENVLHAIEQNPRAHEIEHATRIEEEATSRLSAPAAAGGAGHAAAAPDRTIFAILGHGYETEFDYTKRNILPEGFTLVTIVSSGQTALMPDVCRGVNLLSTVGDKRILNDPANNIDAISKKMFSPEEYEGGRRIRVYTNGGSYPTLYISPLADWNKKISEKRFKTTFISGVRKFPIVLKAESPFHSAIKPEDRELISRGREEEMGMTCNMLSYNNSNAVLDKEIIKKLYTDSLYPTIEQMETEIGKSFLEIRNNKLISLADLFVGLKKGVYYFLICRDTNDNIAAEFDNSWGFIFPRKEREGDSKTKGTYAYEMFRFREQYGKITDPIEKVTYYLNVLNTNAKITDDNGSQFPLSDNNFLRAARLLVSYDEDPTNEKYLPASLRGLADGAPVDRTAFDKYYERARTKTDAVLVARSFSNAAQAAGAAAGGAGSGPHAGGRRRFRKTKKGRRKSKLSRKVRH